MAQKGGLRPTPAHAKTIDELPKMSGVESQQEVIVNTNEGVKRMEVKNFYAPLDFLIDSYQFYTEKFPVDYAVPLLGGELSTLRILKIN